MSARSLRTATAVFVALAVLLVTAGTALAAGGVSKPALSATPTMGEPFTVSGVTTPKAKKGSPVVVKVQVLMKMDGDMYEPMDAPLKAKLTSRSGGYKYSVSLTIPMTGDHAVQAIRYVSGKVAKRSAITYFTVQEAAQQISIDSDSHAATSAPAHTPLEVVFHSPTNRMCGAKVAFVTGDFMKAFVTPLTYTTIGLMPGTYTWRCPMTDCCYGDLIAQ
jgi:hypothetical protein